MLCRKPLRQKKRPSRERDRDPIGRSRGVRRKGAAGRGGGGMAQTTRIMSEAGGSSAGRGELARPDPWARSWGFCPVANLSICAFSMRSMTRRSCRIFKT